MAVCIFRLGIKSLGFTQYVFFWMAGTWDFENLRFWKNVRVLFFKNPQKNDFLKMSLFSESKIPLLAIHKIISHIWEDAPQKVNNDEPDLRFFHGNFWPVISQAVRKPCFLAWIPRGQISGSLYLVGTLPQALFFSRKMAPAFLEALNLWVRCRRRFFISEKWPPDFWHVFRLKSSLFISVSG